MQQIFLLLLNALIWIAFPVCGLIGWIYYIKSQNEERKLWIERGVDPSSMLNPKKRFQFPWLKLGMIILGLGTGFLTIALLINFNIIGHSDAIYPAILCISGGTGLIIAHYLKKPE